ncbi:MAG: M20/M25/M40 family metallo-hydrolase, partial [candidate division Zixibacteria bacterium]|nr:M20/M25/M40 family metallo-hydrolase [candidate division Zixibacteria bacterium]
MHYSKRSVFSLALLFAVITLTSLLAFAEDIPTKPPDNSIDDDLQPVLIKLTLEDSSDYQNAKALGVIAYHRFPDFVLAEYEKTKLGKLDEVGLTYEIVDYEPWTEEYFLVSPIEGVSAKINLGAYGRIILMEQESQVIKTSKEKASELREMNQIVIPILHKPIPLSHMKPKGPVVMFPTSVASIDSLISLVSKDSLNVYVNRLQNFQTRDSYSDSIVKARDWLYNKFTSFGIDSVYLHHFNYDSDQWNVVATVPGTVMPNKVIVVGGHYDSYNGRTDPLIFAPGADDNASGTAATLEMARIIAKNPLPMTVMFVAFAQEEQGLIGSSYFADYLYSHNIDVQLMINSDMIASSLDADPDVVIYGDSTALYFVNIMSAMGNQYTYLNPSYQGRLDRSDHYSFYQYGYDAIFSFEGDFSPYYHTDEDIEGHLNPSYFKEVVKMNLATLASSIYCLLSRTENLKAANVGDGHTLYLNWSVNPSPDNVGYYNVYFGTTSGHYDSPHKVYTTCDTLRNLEENTTYFVAVTAVSFDIFESYGEEISILTSSTPFPPTGLTANAFERL